MINKVILIGNTGSAPEVRALESGIKVAKLRLATYEKFTNRTTGEKIEHTEWHNLTLWRSQADFAEKYIQKGCQIYVEGKIRSRDVVDEATGLRRTVFEIHVDEVRILGRRPIQNAESANPCVEIQAETQVEEQSIAKVETDDGLPF